MTRVPCGLLIGAVCTSLCSVSDWLSHWTAWMVRRHLEDGDPIPRLRETGRLPSTAAAVTRWLHHALSPCLPCDESPGRPGWTSWSLPSSVCMDGCESIFCSTLLCSRLFTRHVSPLQSGRGSHPPQPPFSRGHSRVGLKSRRPGRPDSDSLSRVSRIRCLVPRGSTHSEEHLSPTAIHRVSHPLDGSRHGTS